MGSSNTPNKQPLIMAEIAQILAIGYIRLRSRAGSSHDGYKPDGMDKKRFSIAKLHLNRPSLRVMNDKNETQESRDENSPLFPDE